MTKEGPRSSYYGQLREFNPDKSFTELTELFDKHFKTCESAFVARQRFYAATRNSQESAAEFAARLRGLACKSEFPEAVLDMTLRDRFIMGFGKGPVQDRLFEEKISVSFADAVSVASRKMATHSLQQQVQVKLEPEVLKVSQGKGSSRFKPQFKPSVTPGAQKSAKGEVKSPQRCKVCGRGNHMAQDCRFKDYKCHVCGIQGHLAPVCSRKRDGHRVQNYMEDQDESIFCIKSDGLKPIYLPITIFNKQFSFQLDSEASVSVVSEEFWQSNLEDVALEPSKHLSQAYNQCLLDEKSKALVTISTHKGLYQYTRLPFGVASAPAKFQKIMESLLADLEGVVCFLDDVLICGKDKQESVQRIEAVLSRLRENGLKEILTSAQVLTHYNPDYDIKLSVDASPYGLGGVISHVMPNGSERPIAPFTLVTDNKPLIAIFHPTNGIPQYSANRLRRWAIILSNYQYKIEYVRSDRNSADFLSRALPTKGDVDDYDSVETVEGAVNHISANVDLDEIKRSMSLDNTLTKVVNLVKKGWPGSVKKDSQLWSYFNIRHQLSLDKNLLWGDKGTKVWTKAIIKKIIGKCTFLCQVIETGAIWKRHTNQIRKLRLEGSLPVSAPPVEPGSVESAPGKREATSPAGVFSPVRKRLRREVRPPQRLMYF
ncbi:hypothetical protein GEV33_001559 [Tenebrio molitor]|uniref:CCHC-type domain-containing protein n=1 Tax=Tenebrio molitor TaxID=7067 RepID=A0A8J6HVV1_TENMO|nr:hypothetical protein GEV33_001559 [Tenebrio molitor]